MGERISHSASDGGIGSGLTRNDRFHGAALGAIGALITLALGGAVMFAVRFLLTLNPNASSIQAALTHLWYFSHGFWLIVPATIAGAAIGYDRLLVFFSHFWFTAEPRRQWLSLALWTALAMVCKVTGIMVSLVL